MRTLFGDAVLDIKYYWTMTTELDGIPVVISRTGWTGEVGYEIYLRDPSRGGDLWDRIMDGGQAARDPADRAVRGAPHRGRHLQLRLGHDDRQQPVRGHGPRAARRAAGRPTTSARRPSRRSAARASSRKLVGIEVAGDALPFELSRKCDALHERRAVGTVTDLIWSPRLEKNIGYVWVPIELAGAGNAARDRRPRRRDLAGHDRSHPVPRPEEDRARSADPSAATDGSPRLDPAPHPEVAPLTARHVVSSPLTQDEIAAVRKPYRAASLLPGRAYHDPAIHEFERTRVVPARLGRGRARGGRRGARDLLPGHGRRRAAHRRPRPRRRPARRSTTSAATAARPSSRSRAARPSASSARTTPGSTTSTGRSSGPSTPRTSTTSASTASAWSPVRLATWQGFVFVSLDPGRRRARRLAGRSRPASRAVRLRVAARRPRGGLRGRRQLEVHRRELQRVLPLPGHPPAAQQADPVRPRRRLRPRRAVAGRLDGARRQRRDDGARRRPPRRPAGDRRASPTSTSGGSTTTCSGRRRSCRSIRTTCSSTGSSRPVRITPGSSASGCSSRRRSRRQDFDPSDAIAFWDLTNRQDWHVCELQQRGTRSRSWIAGRFSNQEPSVHAFDLMAVDRYAGDGFTSRRTVRERYDVPPPKPLDEGDPVGAVRLPRAAARHEACRPSWLPRSGRR